MFWFCCGLILGFWLSHRYVVQDLRLRLSKYETKDGYVDAQRYPRYAEEEAAKSDSVKF